MRERERESKSQNRMFVGTKGDEMCAWRQLPRSRLLAEMPQYSG